MAEPKQIYENEEPSRPVEEEEPFAVRRVSDEERAQAREPIPIR